MDELSNRTLDRPVPGVTVWELLSMLLGLIQQWFGTKRVPPLSKWVAKPDAQIHLARFKESLKTQYACASPKCREMINEAQIKY